MLHSSVLMELSREYLKEALSSDFLQVSTKGSDIWACFEETDWIAGDHLSESKVVNLSYLHD